MIFIFVFYWVSIFIVLFVLCWVFVCNGFVCWGLVVLYGCMICCCLLSRLLFSLYCCLMFGFGRWVCLCFSIDWCCWLFLLCWDWWRFIVDWCLCFLVNFSVCLLCCCWMFCLVWVMCCSLLMLWLVVFVIVVCVLWLGCCSSLFWVLFLLYLYLCWIVIGFSVGWLICCWCRVDSCLLLLMRRIGSLYYW